jgi:hypothetical protein
MKRLFLLLAAGAAMLIAAGTVHAQAADAWLHIRVEESHKPSKVSVNLPLSVVEAVIAAAPEKFASKGRIHIHDEHLSLAEMREIWSQLKTAGDTDFVTVESDDENVTVRRQGERILVLVDKPGREEMVRVEAPVALVDAVLAGEGEEVNVKTALAALKSIRGDVVHVADGDSKVRIWIDETKE